MSEMPDPPAFVPLLESPALECRLIWLLSTLGKPQGDRPRAAPQPRPVARWELDPGFGRPVCHREIEL